MTWRLRPIGVRAPSGGGADHGSLREAGSSHPRLWLAPAAGRSRVDLGAVTLRQLQQRWASRRSSPSATATVPECLAVEQSVNVVLDGAFAEAERRCSIVSPPSPSPTSRADFTRRQRAWRRSQQISPAHHDVIAAGGSHAGMAAAQLPRPPHRAGDRRRCCIRFAEESHGFLGQDGADPADVAFVGATSSMRYPTLTWVDGLAEQAGGERDAFTVGTADGGTPGAACSLPPVLERSAAGRGLLERLGQ